MKHLEAPVVAPCQDLNSPNKEITWHSDSPTTRFIRRSLLTGVTHIWDIPASGQQVFEWRHKGVMAQTAFPNLTPDQREFIMTGITPQEWKEKMPSEE